MARGEESFAETYRRHDYALAPQIFQDADLEPFRQVIGRGVEALARSMHADGKIPELHGDAPFDRRLALLAGGKDMAMRSWDRIALSPELFHLICHPRLLDLMESLLGPEIVFNGDFHLRPKLPESNLTAFPWHQDSQYYGEPTRHMHVVTVTIPLVDLTVENGCLWMIGGSRSWGYLQGERGGDQNIRTIANVEERGTPIPVPMKTGDILAFSNLTFHASKLNRTSGVRWTLDLRYSPSRELREAQGMSADERAAYDFFFPKLRSQGFRPATVRSQKKQMPSYEQWLDQ